MATHPNVYQAPSARSGERTHNPALSAAIVLLGRILFAGIFVIAAPMNFTRQSISYAAAQGVPAAGILVPLAGLIGLVGSLSVLLGYHARIGAWLLVIFLVPVTFMLHNFWAVSDPMMRQDQMAHFMKNISMLGGAFLITQFGAGPLSLDARHERPSAGK